MGSSPATSWNKNENYLKNEENCSLVVGPLTLSLFVLFTSTNDYGGIKFRIIITYVPINNLK